MLRTTQLRSPWALSNPVYQSTVLSLTLTLLSGVTGAEEPAAASIGLVLERANTLYSEKKFDAARQAFEQAIESDKGSIPAWRGLGWSHWALGQKQRAYQIWTDLVKAFPNDTPTLLALGKASEQDNRRQEAADYYSRVVKLDPHNQDARQGRARLSIAQHKFQSAEQDLKPVLTNAPSDTNAQSMLADALIGQGRYQEAEGILRPLTRAEPTSANLRRLGKVLAETGKYGQAADAYKASLGGHADSDTLNAWRGLGASLRKSGQNQRAYPLWLGILQVFPNDLPTLLAIGKASEQDGLWQQGLDYYARVLQKSPGEYDAHLGRARLFTAQQDYKAAEAEIKAVLGRSPSDIKANFALVENLVAQGRGEEAAPLLRPLVERDPSAKNLSRMGTILADLDRDDESAYYFEKSVQLDPEDAAAVVGLAHVYWNRHAYDQSIALLQRYLSTHLDNDVVRARLAEHASAASNWELAERELRTLVNKHPDDSKWQIKLASLLHHAGRHEDATKIATEVLTKEPDKIVAVGLLADDAVFSGDLENAVFWTKRLTAIEPTPDRFTRLAKLRMELGERMVKEGKQDAAMIQYRAAEQELRQANALDPIKSMASVDIVRVLRLQGRLADATALGEQLYANYPKSADVIKELAISYKEQGNYLAARSMLEQNMPFFPNSSALKQSLAELTYDAGEKDTAFNILNKIKEVPERTVPVLLYHGISVSERQDTVPAKSFRDQMLALKKDGYQAITPAQLRSFFEDGKPLPAKPILITFDDARADSFKYADPVLTETGFKATMFVPVGDVAMHQPYAAVWPTIRKMYATGRWDMQCHGADAQHYVPVNAKGDEGHFLANRMWINEAGRLETNEEYKARIEHDLLACKETMARELPGIQIFAFAFPYGDQGHRSLSNAPDAFNINQSVVKKHFKLAFNVDNTYLPTGATPKFILPRFEVPRTYSGQDLVHQLKTIDPEMSTTYKLARLDMESGHYKQALESYGKLADKGVIDNADFLLTSGKILTWSGDHAGAREQLEKAAALRFDDAAIQKQIAVLDNRLRPSTQVSGQYFEDNNRRSYFSLSPSVQYPVSDGLSLAAYYKYLDFDQKLDDTTSVPAPGEQHFQVTGNQFEGRLNYELGARSLLSLSAGVADFSGDTSSALGTKKSGSVFPLGSARLETGVSDRVDLSIGVDHTYVNTAGAIVEDLAFTRFRGGTDIKLSDPLNLNVNYSYFDYTDNNQRHRTEVELDAKVWDDPGVTVGAQFIHDDTQKTDPLFWTPQNYLSFSAPVTLKKNWGQSVVATVSVAPGMGKEAAGDLQFQINTTGSLNWNVNDALSMNVSAGRYEAATYSNFSVFAGVALKF